MAIRNIVKEGDEVLAKVCRPVTVFDDRLRQLVDDMKDTLIKSGGLGLAAPQIGILRRVCIVMDEDEQYLELVNPEIVSTEGEQEGLEGCLSLAGMYGLVTRPMKVKIKAQDRYGNPVEYEREGITARCFCHETDHLDGHMYNELCEVLMTEADIEAMLERGELEVDED